jgi:hypothetical protein
MPTKTFIVIDGAGEALTTFMTSLAEAMLLAPRRGDVEIQEHDWQGKTHVAARVCARRRGGGLWQPV